MAGVQQLIRRFEQGAGQNNAANLKAEYTRLIRPAYVRRYGGGNIPAELFIDEGDKSFNGAGSPGLVLVSMGVANYATACIRTFAVAHETGHAVACIEFGRVGVTPFHPIGADAKRHEHMADLIAMRVLKEFQPAIAAEIMGRLGLLAQALGPGGLMHPSGQARTDLIRKLYFGQPFGQLFAALANRTM